MRKNLVALLIGIALLAGVLAGGALVFYRAASTPEDRAFVDTFHHVEIGMPEHRVIELLGEPDERSTEFSLAQEHGFEEAYRRAVSSNSVRYLVWRRHLDFVYTVGVNASGDVAIKEMGGT